jgi:hypothetical protein
LLNDIYYSDNYISLYIKDDEELFSFEYKEGENIFINKTIKRPILNIGNTSVDDGFFDLETAYGYGGFYTNSEDSLFIDKAMKKYYEKCVNEHVIAEFIRFHPFNDFPSTYNNYLEFNIYDRDVVVKNLTEDVFTSYVSKVRNTVKRAKEKVDINESNNIDKFIELYNETMKKNNAGDFYFFKKEYYEKLFQDEKVKLYEVVFEDNIIAMGFFMYDSNICHYHLSANTDISYKLNSNYALLDYVFHIAKEKGIQYFLLGGGTISSADDKLLKFKQKFSKQLKPFYISGKIYNKEIYDKYNTIWQEQSEENIKYFLKYRLEMQ